MRSTWVVVDVSRALTHYLGAWGFVGFTLVALGLAFVPLFDRGPERDLKRRPAVATLGFVFFVGFLAAWIAGRQLRSAPPPETLRAATPDRLPPDRRQFFIEQKETGQVQSPEIPARTLLWLCSSYCDAESGAVINLRSQPELRAKIDRVLAE